MCATAIPSASVLLQAMLSVSLYPSLSLSVYFVSLPLPLPLSLSLYLSLPSEGETNAVASLHGQWFVFAKAQRAPRSKASFCEPDGVL